MLSGMEETDQSTISTHPLLATQTTAWWSDSSIRSCSVDSEYALATKLTACLAFRDNWPGVRHGERCEVIW